MAPRPRPRPLSPKRSCGNRKEPQPFDAGARTRHGARRGRRLLEAQPRTGAQRESDRVLAAVAELAAADAVERDLLWHPLVRNDREAETDEVRRLVRERRQRHIAELSRPIRKRGDQRNPGTLPAGRLVDDEGADLRHLRTQRGQFAAADDVDVGDCHDKAVGVPLDVFERGRKQVPDAEVRGDQIVNGGRVSGDTGAKLNVDHIHERASPTTADAIAASSSGSASSISFSVMTYGGSRRTTVSDVRLISNRRSRAASTTDAAGRSSSTPHINPAPRTSVTAGC